MQMQWNLSSLFDFSKLLTYAAVRRKKDVREVVHGVCHNVEIFQKYDVLLVSFIRHQAFGRIALIDCFHEDFQRSLFLSNLPDSFLPFVLNRGRTNCGVGTGLEHPQP